MDTIRKHPAIASQAQYKYWWPSSLKGRMLKVCPSMRQQTLQQHTCTHTQKQTHSFIHHLDVLAYWNLFLQATGSRIGAILQATSTLAIGVILSFTFSWKMTLVSLIPIPLIFLGVFLESRVIHGHGLKEKSALEAATKVSHDKTLFNVYSLFIL